MYKLLYKKRETAHAVSRFLLWKSAKLLDQFGVEGNFTDGTQCLGDRAIGLGLLGKLGKLVTADTRNVGFCDQIDLGNGGAVAEVNGCCGMHGVGREFGLCEQRRKEHRIAASM